MSQREKAVVPAPRHRKPSSRAKAHAKGKQPARRPATIPVPTSLPDSAAPRSVERSACLIVGIGASAGGLEAMEEFFRHIPPRSGMAFVVVSHQPPTAGSFLPDLLSKCTAMPVAEVTDGLPVEGDHVYLSPGGTHLAILRGTLHLMEPDRLQRAALPIDYFFHSLAVDQKRAAVGIILSGTGTDGTAGLRAIKARSGLTIAQNPQMATYQSMPRSAIDAGVVGLVKPPEEMWEPLLAYSRRLAKRITARSEPGTAPLLQKLFLLLRDRTGNDFSLYKQSSLQRRIERRMDVYQIEDLRQYLRFVQTNPSELDALFKEFLIGVTRFFRDPQAYDALWHKGLPALLEGRPAGSTLRVWVAGCSTGEEAYSLAILLREYLTKHNLQIKVQIFASDLDRAAIETARSGLYPVAIAGDMTQERLQRFFTREGSHYRVKKDIRDMVVFATHNLVTDVPFTKLDLLSCRNLLIYLEARAQQRLVPLFHYVLRPDGILFLGSSETISGSERLFAVIDRKWRLFRRAPGPGSFPRPDPIPIGLTRIKGPTRIEDTGSTKLLRPASIPDVVQRLLMVKYALAAVIVNDRGDVVYVHGYTGAYLKPASGPPPYHVLEMARKELRSELAAALRLAAGREQEAVRRGVQIATDWGVLLADLTVQRLLKPEPLRGLFLVTFAQVRSLRPDPHKKAAAVAMDAQKKGEIELQQELAHMKQRLQHTIEELQKSNEEVKSSNEELHSTNEELQTINQELEAAKEELDSMNEELCIINAELQGKLEELGEVNDDLQNLLNSTEIATIFLDNDMRIKRFTSEARRISNLIPIDIGRPLSDMVAKLAYDRLLQDAQDVLHSLVVREREVQALDGTWFLMRILPYRTARNTIEGLVLTFLDITKMKEVEKVLLAAQGFAASIVETVRESLVVLDDLLRVISANRSFYQTFQLTPREVEHQSFYHLCGGAWDIPDLRALLEDILPKRTSFQDFVVEKVFPRVGRKVLMLNGRRLEQESSQPGRILLAFAEVPGEAVAST